MNGPGEDDGLELPSPGTNVETQEIVDEVYGRLFRSKHEPPQARTIGGFTVLEAYGRGGMGVIYRAEDPVVDREVAIKLVRPRADADRQGWKRLLREARALGKVQHPNVVQLFEAHVLEDRQVYLAMEFIHGQHAGEWLREEHPWREILEVFVAAGRGLAAVHRAGLIHRDFKPANIMIADDGRVKLVDLGLSCAATDDHDVASLPTLVSGDDDAETRLTRDGQVVGTLGFIAPELFLGHGADSLSDQFSFCVSLYFALFGRLPFQPRSDAGESGGDVRGRYHAPSNADVPNRVIKAIERGLALNPAERFPSIDDLLESLVEPRKSAAWPGIVVVSVIVLFTVAALVVARQPGPCSGFSTLAEKIWNDGRQRDIERAFTATSVDHAAGSFAIISRGVDQYVNAWVSARTEVCDDSKVRRDHGAAITNARVACLERAYSVLETTLDGLENVRAQGVEVAPSHLDKLPALEDCGSRAIMALSCHAQLTDPDDQAAEDSVLELLNAARAALIVADYGTSVDAARAGVEAAERSGLARLVADANFVLGEILYVRGEISDARDALETARDTAETSGCTDLSADAYSRLIKIDALFGGTPVELARERSRLQFAKVAALGDSGARLADAHNDRGLIQLHLARAYDDAERSFLSALEVRAGDESDAPYTMLARADTLLNLSSALAAKGETERSLQRLDDAIATRTAAVGPDHPLLAKERHNLAVRQFEHGYYSFARESDTMALQLARAGVGADSLLLADILLGLARTEDVLHNYEDAIRYALEVYEIQKARLDERDPSRVTSIAAVAQVYTDSGQPELAIPLLIEVQGILDASSTATGYEKAINQHRLADAYNQGGKPERGLEHARRAVTLLRKTNVDPNDRELAFALQYLGEALVAIAEKRGSLSSLNASERAEASSALERAITIWSARGDNAEFLAYSQWGLAKVHGVAVESRKSACEQASAAYEYFREHAGDQENREMRDEIARWRATQCERTTSTPPDLEGHNGIDDHHAPDRD